MSSVGIRKKTSILHISDEVMVLILTFLRAVDLGACCQVDQTVFTRERLSDAASYLLCSVFDKTSPALSKKNALLPRIEVLPVVLYVNELSSVLSVISSRPHLKNQLVSDINQFFWISTSWLAATRKFCESIAALELDSRKRLSKTKQRKLHSNKRNSNPLIPPSANINADITCCHGCLLPVKEGRKKMVDAGTWHYLHQLYGAGVQFPSTQGDCSKCLQEAREKQLLRSAEKGPNNGSSSSIEYLSIDQTLERGLTSLVLRRSGVPPSRRVDNNTSSAGSYNGDHFMTEEDFQDEEDMLAWAIADAAVTDDLEEHIQEGTYQQQQVTPSVMHPLKPGVYNVVPRAWLRVWRKFLKDPFSGSSSTSSSSGNGSSSPYAAKYGLPPLDCTSLLCHNHGLLVIPLHLEEFLVGLRRNLLNGLGKYRGEVVEVLTAEEWEMLQFSLNSLSDFSVRFTLDENYDVTWNIPVCERCDKVNYSL